MANVKTYKWPTLNPRYNQLLASWAKQGHYTAPECPHCSEDMTGRDVFFDERRDEWLCDECHEYLAHERMAPEFEYD